MSRSQHGRDMDRPPVARGPAPPARGDDELFLDGASNYNDSSSSSSSNSGNGSVAPGGVGNGTGGPGHEGGGGQRPSRPKRPNRAPAPIAPASISLPTRIPQWPLVGPIPSPIGDRPEERYQPPAGRTPPQRPPRPSVVPSILDGSRVQDPVPSFHYSSNRRGPVVDDADADADSFTPGLMSPASGPMSPTSNRTISSIGTIPEFPAPGDGNGGRVVPIITDVPVAQQARRNMVSLGPPPSARRGASSLYSTTSFVSPIPEESPGTRSRESYASSAAMPAHQSWGSGSIINSPEAFSPISAGPGPAARALGGHSANTSTSTRHTFDPTNAIFEEGIDEDIQASFYMDNDDGDADIDDAYEAYDKESGGRGDEQGLVRSASIGKRARPALVTTGSPSIGSIKGQPSPRPPQRNGSGSSAEASSAGASSVGASSSGQSLGAYAAAPDSNSSQTLPWGMSARGTIRQEQQRQQRNQAAMTRAMLGPYAAAGLIEPTGSPRIAPPGYGQPVLRVPAVPRRPEIDAARGSLTSLTDMIKRATRLVALIDQGQRPASRYESFDVFSAKSSGGEQNPAESRRESDISDMLAAFPPPAHHVPARRSLLRGSWFRGRNSWSVRPQDSAATSPPGYHTGHSPSPDSPEMYEKAPPSQSRNGKRRCCGLPRWVFILLIVLLVAGVIVAIVIPVLFALKVLPLKSGSNNEDPIAACQAKLSCSNGGTAVVSQGVCSCICTGGFTGSTCDVAGSAGCTTTNLVGDDGSSQISNVTLGSAIPRLVASSQSNFSVPLSSTSILAKFNSDSLSCVAQNSLVTFNGRAATAGDNNDAVPELKGNHAGAVVTVVTVAPGEIQVVSMANYRAAASGDNGAAYLTTISATTVTVTVTVTLLPLPTASLTRAPTDQTTATTTINPSRTGTSAATTPTSPAVSPTPTFTVTDETLEFARVAVLFILQEETVSDATAAQGALQRFFSKAAGATGADVADARALNVGGDNTVDLVDFGIDLGTGEVVGGKSFVGGRRKRADDALLREEWNGW